MWITSITLIVGHFKIGKNKGKKKIEISINNSGFIVKRGINIKNLIECGLPIVDADTGLVCIIRICLNANVTLLGFGRSSVEVCFLGAIHFQAVLSLC